MLYNSVDRPAVEKLVKEFYSDVLKDPLLGPIFTRSLGADIKKGKWHEHLNTLHNFWMAMMTGEKNYWGSPFPPHAFLGPLEPEMFERWLELFHATVYRLFTPELADKFYKKSNILSEQFMEYLEIGKYAEDEDEDD